MTDAKKKPKPIERLDPLAMEVWASIAAGVGETNGATAYPGLDQDEAVFLKVGPHVMLQLIAEVRAARDADVIDCAECGGPIRGESPVYFMGTSAKHRACLAGPDLRALSASEARANALLDGAAVVGSVVTKARRVVDRLAFWRRL